MRSTPGRSGPPDRGAGERSWAHLDSGAVLKPGWNWGDDLLPGVQPGEHFHGVLGALAGGDEARSSGSLFRHEDGLQLTIFHEGRCGRHHDFSAAKWKESAA